MTQMTVKMSVFRVTIVVFILLPLLSSIYIATFVLDSTFSIASTWLRHYVQNVQRCRSLDQRRYL
jgi:hypothetical protein